MLTIHKPSRHGIHFVTITTVEWIDIFTQPQYYKILAESLKFCQKNKGLILYEYVFMTNHIHFIAQGTEDGPGLDDIVRDFKRFTTKEILHQLKFDHRRYIIKVLEKSHNKNEKNIAQVWQKGNYPELVEGSNFLEQKVRYIRMNPVKKEYVKEPQDWLWGSARQKMLMLEPDHEDVMVGCENVGL